jgi:hypothetical protein
VLAILLLALGFFIGRKTIKMPSPTVIIKYEKGEPIHDTLYKVKPYKVTEPADTLDIIRYCVNSGKYKELWPKEEVPVYITKEDTTKIMRDWATKREYKETLFDSDTLGTCTIDAEVQYNRINSLEYTFTPIYKTVTNTVYEIKKYSGFVGAGYSRTIGNGADDNKIDIDAGFFYKDKYGAMIKYERSINMKQDYIGGSILYKF